MRQFTHQRHVESSSPVVRAASKFAVVNITSTITSMSSVTQVVLKILQMVLKGSVQQLWGFPGGSVVENPPAMQESQEMWV